MTPNQRTAKACKALEPFGFHETLVKTTLKQLLKVYDNIWELIEDDSYKVLIEAIMDKTDQEKGVKSSVKHAPVCIEQPATEVTEPISKRLRTRSKKGKARLAKEPQHGEKEVVPLCSKAQSSSEDEELQPLFKRSRTRLREEASCHSYNSQTEVAKTSLTREKQGDVGSSSSLGTKTDSKDFETPLKKMSQQSKKDLATGELKSSKMLIHYKRGKRVGTAITSYKNPKIEPCLVVTPAENILDMYHNDYLDTVIEEPMAIDQFEDEAPLVVIHPGATPASLGENSSSGIIDLDGDDLELLECSPVDGEDEDISHLVCGDYSSNENDSVVKEDALHLSKKHGVKLDCAKEKEEGFSDSLHFDVASSSNGEVKLALICNSSQQSDFSNTSLAELLKVVEDKFRKSYRIMEPSFSLTKLMTELCEHLSCGTVSSNDQRLTSVCVPHVHSIKKILGCRDEVQPDCPNPSVFFENLIEVMPQIPKLIAVGRLDALHCIIGFKSKDAHNILSGIDMKLRVLECPKLSTTCGVEHVENCFFLDGVNPGVYLDDITKGEERLKIPLVMGSTSEDLPGFLYIAHNLVYDKAHVNFRLCNVLDEDCCSQCFQDCLTSVIPCACARKTGGEFAYSLTGLIKDQFLKEFLPLHDKGGCYFYCTDCPFERLKHNLTNSCKGHRVRKFIKECWAKCGCNKACGNRVVQRGITRNLQVFTTPEGKGWGLRTVESLPRGAFVCEYVGEIVTHSELEERKMQNLDNQKHVDSVPLDAGWSMDKNFKDEEVLSLDATSYGNVARFINHRCCDANLVEIPVEVETPDRHYYHFAFFTTRDVAAMEELTWDYGIDTSKAFKCLCQSPFCRD